MRLIACNRIKISSGSFAKAAALLLAAALAACAPSADFQTVPQKGAWRSGTYPSFSTRPQAATAQFSEAERQSLSRTLQAEGRQARNIADNDAGKRQAMPDAASSRRQADQDISNTLRQITGKP